jgi:hypothetical protein
MRTHHAAVDEKAPAGKIIRGGYAPHVDEHVDGERGAEKAVLSALHLAVVTEEVVPVVFRRVMSETR